MSKPSSLPAPRSLPFEARRFLKRVQTFAAAHALWDTDSRILIAVSGGPDSVCLLDILAFLSQKYSFSLGIAHVNYQLRGKDSATDERFVRTLAQHYQIPCFIQRYPVGRPHDENTLREFRYAFFEKLRKQHRFDRLALGHHMGDQAETLLMNLIRGAGPMGMAGMLPKHNSHIRPLLALDRTHILRYLAACSLEFRTDESNTDTRYTRNRIRHELLPLLRDRFNPNIIATLARSASRFQVITPCAPQARKTASSKACRKPRDKH